MTRKKHTGACHICYTNLKTTISSCGCCICPSCWHQMIITKIQDTNSLHETITCPKEKCAKQLSINTLSNKLPKSLQNQITQANLNVYLAQATDIRRCPSSKCNYAGTINISSSCSKNLICEACGTTWRDKVHYTKIEKIQDSINQATRQRNEVFSMLWKKFKTKKCPSCKTLIEKNGGCDHMTCCKCAYEFCWICSAASPSHNNFYHTLRNQIFPMICIFFMFLIFFSIFYALYLLPPINYAVHATVVPAVKWCWPYVKAFVIWIGYNLFAAALLNLTFFHLWILILKLTKEPCPVKLSKKGSLGIVLACIGLTWYSQVSQKMLIIGIIETSVLFLVYLHHRFGQRPLFEMRRKVR